MQNKILYKKLNFSSIIIIIIFHYFDKERNVNIIYLLFEDILNEIKKGLFY